MTDTLKEKIELVLAQMTSGYRPELLERLEKFIQKEKQQSYMEREKEIIVLKSDIARAIGHMQGCGHPDQYLVNKYFRQLTTTGDDELECEHCGELYIPSKKEECLAGDGVEHCSHCSPKEGEGNE